jgi:multisubunit Na+/H+ antiporter MnhG subunit
MNDEHIKRIIDGTYDEAREETVGSMLRDFYNRRMLSTIIFVWVWGLFVVGVAIYGAVRFYEADQTKSQIMYAAVFIAACQFIALTKIFAWQMIHRNSIKREVKSLELRIAALTSLLERKTEKG